MRADLTRAAAVLVAVCWGDACSPEPEAPPAPETPAAAAAKPAAPQPAAKAGAPKDAATPAPAAAAAAPIRNTVRWSTSSELDSFGFDVYRGTAEEGPF